MVIRNAFRCSKCFLVLVLMSGFIFSAMGLTAPYMTGAQATDYRHISISWRNNDIATEQFIILRKTSGAPFQVVDSVPFPATTFSDSNLAPSTQYFYAVLALAQGVVSDTSNILSAVTAQMPAIFLSPYMTVTLNPISNIDSIAYYDASTVEKGYRLYRMAGAGKFSLIDSQISTSPYLTGWMFFKDSGFTPNTLYTYKVEVFNNSDSLFSSDTAIYIYKEPERSHSYTFTKITEFAVAPIGWSEKIGDSLYVVENDISSPHAITVINIKDRSNPALKGYLRSDSLPLILQHTRIADYIKFNVTSNPPWARKYFPVNGFDFVFRGDTLLQYNSSTQALINSIVLSGLFGGWGNGINAQINDSILLLNVSVGYFMSVYSYLYTFKFSNLKLDTLSSIPIGSSSANGSNSYSDTYKFLGYQNQKAFFFSHLTQAMSPPTKVGLYHIYDFSVNPISPLHIQNQTDFAPFKNGNSACFIDSFITFGYSVSNDSLTLVAFDIRSAQSKPLSSFTDTLFKGGAINNIILDSATNEIFMVGANSFAIYKYSQGPIAVKMNPRSLQSVSAAPLTAHIAPNGILIKFDNQQDIIEGLSIYNVAGKIVRHFPASLCGASQGIVWDAKDGRGAALSPGPYFLVLKGAKNTKSTRVFLMRR